MKRLSAHRRRIAKVTTGITTPGAPTRGVRRFAPRSSVGPDTGHVRRTCTSCVRCVSRPRGLECRVGDSAIVAVTAGAWAPGARVRHAPLGPDGDDGGRDLADNVGVGIDADRSRRCSG